MSQGVTNALFNSMPGGTLGGYMRMSNGPLAGLTGMPGKNTSSSDKHLGGGYFRRGDQSIYRYTQQGKGPGPFSFAKFQEIDDGSIFDKNIQDLTNEDYENNPWIKFKQVDFSDPAQAHRWARKQGLARDTIGKRQKTGEQEIRDKYKVGKNLGAKFYGF